jgi:hypothetical protein
MPPPPLREGMESRQDLPSLSAFVLYSGHHSTSWHHVAATEPTSSSCVAGKETGPKASVCLRSLSTQLLTKIHSDPKHRMFYHPQPLLTEMSPHLTLQVALARSASACRWQRCLSVLHLPSWEVLPGEFFLQSSSLVCSIKQVPSLRWELNHSE